MKNITLLLSLLIVTFMSSCQNKKSSEEESSVIKNVSFTSFKESTLNETFTTINDKTVNFSEILKTHRGNVTVLYVWASWCPDCIKGFPDLFELQKQFPTVNFVFLSLDRTKDKWKESIEKYQLVGSHYHIDQKMKDSFGASIQLDWIPRYMVLDANNTIILSKAIVADDPELIKTIKSAIK